MHDVDRTLQETESEFGETEYNETAAEGEEFLGDVLGGLLGGEFEAHEQGFLGEEEAFEHGFLGEEEFEHAYVGENEAVFDEVTEMELAAELLGVQNEEELEQFLGNLVKRAGKFIGNVAKGPIGKVLIPVLKKAAKVALPVAGAALGNLVVPGVGGAIGGKLASAAGSMFGLEFEGLSPQDREFEAARRVVRFAGTATKRLARTPTSIPPRAAIRAAIVPAARRHIPGLLRPRVVTNVTNVIRQSQAQAARARANGGRASNRVTASGGTYGSQSATPSPTYGGGSAYGGGIPTYGASPIYASPVFGAGYVTPSIETPSYTNGSSSASYAGPAGAMRTGRWYRRGRKIVLVGV